MKFKKIHKIVCVFILIFASCSKHSYLEEVPYAYPTPTEEDILAYFAEKDPNNIGFMETKVIYDKNLSDELMHIKEKYAIITGSRPDEIVNYKFYQVVDEWISPYYEGVSPDKNGGYDCVKFVSYLYNEVYGVNLPQEASNIYTSNDMISKFTGRAFLEEGDIIFFRYSKRNPVSDMAIYLRNNRIVACTPGGGLAIYDFNDDYFQRRYVASARRRVNNSQ